MVEEVARVAPMKTSAAIKIVKREGAGDGDEKGGGSRESPRSAGEHDHRSRWGGGGGSLVRLLLGAAPARGIGGGGWGDWVLGRNG
jgi:hypothetical protein